MDGSFARKSMPNSFPFQIYFFGGGGGRGAGATKVMRDFACGFSSLSLNFENAAHRNSTGKIFFSSSMLTFL
jgi:hypothetical protein